MKKLTTPLGEISVYIDNVDVKYNAIKLTNDPTIFPNLDGRYKIEVKYDSDNLEHLICCIIDDIDYSRIQYYPESGERLECQAFYQGDTKLSIGIECDTAYYETGERIGSYDYDSVYLENGIGYHKFTGELYEGARKMNSVFKNVVNIIDKGESEGVSQLSLLSGDSPDIKLLNLIIKNIKSGVPAEYTKYALEVETLKYISTGKLEDGEIEKITLIKFLLEDMYTLKLNVIQTFYTIIGNNEVKDLIAMHRLTGSMSIL